ncbi:MAG: phosphomethylpyrimidine synthase ThiC, partial [Planctomycetes bacterium]|nr:phosphomethylpyrimidine synthase ThiC [Planctomycetota bacterium]
MTQYEQAKAGVITDQMRQVGQYENLPAELIRDEIAAGRLVIPANRLHLEPTDKTNVTLKPCGIGRAVSTKINANIGTSPVSSCDESERLKLELAVKYGADAVMDLSTGGDLSATRRNVIAHSSVPIGTVPIYSMIAEKPLDQLTRDDILTGIAEQAAQGVDFFTIHAAIRREHLRLIDKRKIGIVSRGGALLAQWMVHNDSENPMYELFDEISEIMRQYDVTYSLGDALRPG